MRRSTRRSGELRELRCSQSQGVSDHGDGAEAHRSGGDHGIEQQAEERIEDAGRDRHAERCCRRRQRTGSGGCSSSSRRLSLIALTMPAQVAFDQGDAGGFDRDVRAGPHCDAHVGFGQRRRVVDAVTGHRHDLRPASSVALTPACLSSGATPASNSSIPSCPATLCAVFSLSPVSMMIRSRARAARGPPRASIP